MKKTVNMNELLKNVKNGGMSGVYKITRKSDGMVYIGQSICIRQRLEQHILNQNVDEDSAGIDAAIKKEGADKFTYETVVAAPDLTTEQLWFFEALNIEQYDSYNKGFNRTRGNHRGAYDALDLRNKHKVTSDITKVIEEKFKLNFRDKKVFLIGNFNRKFVNYIEYQNAVVITIDSYEESDFIDKFNEGMENMESKDFDIIISNPPYGTIGRKITRKIIDEIEFKEFINILPTRDYVKAAKDLYQYVDINSITTVNAGFRDAATVTHIAKIQKYPNLYISKDEFEIETFEDKSLKRFFYENSKREYEAIDRMNVWKNDMTFEEIFDINKTIIFGFRDAAHGHMPYSKNVDSYRWNVEKSIDAQYMKKNHWNATGNFGKGQISYHCMVFSSSVEKDNFAKFMYSEDGFRFMSKTFVAINTDGSAGKICMPKVDWTKEWTVEEILKDYGYTAKEIQEVMDDLKNFKGMNA